MVDNLFANLPASLPEELVTVLAERGAVRIERIVSEGHASPPGFWYDQDKSEWVMLLSGSAELAVESDSGIQRLTLAPGDHLLLPAHRRHRVESTDRMGRTVWLAVFF